MQSPLSNKLAQSTLRIMTAGSVDDGKSTLIGRLMHDLDLITDDVLDDLKAASLRNGRGKLDLSLYTDGLVAEREQGITIDVAYRYFRHLDRSFILCDAPGHVQYTRNMVCAASQADVALIMIDARSGPTEQTHRHVRLAQMLQVSKLVFVVNKLDLVGFSESTFNEISLHLATLATADIVPVCALDGDNVVHTSKQIGPNRLSWYDGPTLLDLLRATDANSRFPIDAPLRFAVQSVVRPTGRQTGRAEHLEHLHDYRALAGRVESGSITVGQRIQVSSVSNENIQYSTVKAIHVFSGDLQNAIAGDSISIVLADDVDVARGDLIADADVALEPSNELLAQWCWMHDKPAVIGQKLLIKQATRTVQARIMSIDAKLNLTSGEFIDSIPGEVQTLVANEIARIRLQLAQPLLNDRYIAMPRTGSLIAIDPQKLDTLAAAVI
jgi:sulfate adenylyltransferase subunit 1